MQGVLLSLVVVHQRLQTMQGPIVELTAIDVMDALVPSRCYDLTVDLHGLPYP
jgi:hypothetical protein